LTVFRNFGVMLGHIFVSYLSCYCFIKGVLNIRDTNTVGEKYSRLYRPINVFIFRIYNMG
jgi:hypothetical protein